METAGLIRGECPTCKKAFRVPANAAGKRGKCAGCGNVMTVPRPTPAGSEPAARPESQPVIPVGQPPPSHAVPAPNQMPMGEPVGEPVQMPVPEAPQVSEPMPNVGPVIVSRPTPGAGHASRNRSRKSSASMGTILAGVGMMVGAVVWFGLGLLGKRIFFYPPILFCIEFVTMCKGFVGS